MSLLQTLKTDALEARKARHTTTATTLTTLIGELETFCKNAGREVTDADVVAFVKKTLKNVTETLSHLDKTDPRAIPFMTEAKLLEHYLPKQMTEDELRALIESFVQQGMSTVGDVMKTLKVQYNGQYDGAMASALLKARFGK